MFTLDGGTQPESEVVVAPEPEAERSGPLDPDSINREADSVAGAGDTALDATRQDIYGLSTPDAQEFFMSLAEREGDVKAALVKLGEKGVTKLYFEKGSVSFWMNGQKYNISAEFFRDVNPTDPNSVKAWLNKKGEIGVTKIHFGKEGITYWEKGVEYRIPPAQFFQ